MEDALISESGLKGAATNVAAEADASADDLLLPKELEEAAQRELGETPAVRASTIAEMQESVRQSPLSNAWLTSVPLLLMFLRHAKFDVKKAAARLRAMDKFVVDFGAAIGDATKLRAEMFTELYGQGFMRILSGRTRDGAIISTLIPSKMAPLADPSILVKWNIWALQRMALDPHVQVHGQVILESFENFSLMQAMRFNNSMPKEIMRANFNFMQKCAPFRLRGIWIVKQPYYMSFMMAIAKPFMGAKMRQRVRMFGGRTEELFELIPRESLPVEEFGGGQADNGMEWFEAQREAERREEAAAVVAPEDFALVV